MTVSVYDENGWKEDLSSLKLGRLGHACTSFVSGGKKVCFHLFDVYITNLTNFKLMMVSGGEVWGSGYTDTSEIWNGTEWRLSTGKLPYSARDVRMAFIDNRILFMGIEARTTRRSILGSDCMTLIIML